MMPYNSEDDAMMMMLVLEMEMEMEMEMASWPFSEGLHRIGGGAEPRRAAERKIWAVGWMRWAA